jgi:molybdenum cofactor biosynthesis enzyme MoaA
MSWRLLRTPDYAAVLAMHREIFAEPISTSEFNRQTQGREAFLYWVDRPGEARPVGFAVFLRRNGEAELWRAGILPQRRHQGAGSFLLEAGRREMAAQGCSRLKVTASNRWPAWLSMLFKRGFRLLAAGPDREGDDIRLELYTELRQRREMRYALTERCNFRCIFCHNEGLGRGTREPMPVEQVLEILQEAMRLGYTDITFTGGEPLREKARLFRLLEGLGRATARPDLTLVTNGSLFDRAVVDALSAYPGEKKIHLSLHAADPETFRLVTRTLRKDLFDRVAANIRLAAEAGLKVKMNHVVLRDLNHTRIMAAVELARSLGATAIKFLELLVLPENREDYRLFYDIDAIEQDLAGIVTGPPERKNLRQRVFRHRADTRFTIELQRLTCSIGCGHCRETRDRTFGSGMHFHPCFVRSKRRIAVASPAALDRALREGDRQIDGYAARFRDSSPTLVQKEIYVDRKTEFYFIIDSMSAFSDYLKSIGFRPTAAVGFYEEYYRPKLRSAEWERFERVLKIGWDQHRPQRIELLYTDHSYTLHPELGLEVATRFLDPAGPMRFAGIDRARRFLDRLDFERFLALEWELETWGKNGLRVNLGVASGRASAKVCGPRQAALRLLQCARSYPGRFQQLREPLPLFMNRPLPSARRQGRHPRTSGR